MVHGAILEKGERWYTHFGKIFAGMNHFQQNYNWLITDCTCYLMDPVLENRLRDEYCWLTGEELTEIVKKDDFQWVWAVLSGFEKDVPFSRVLEYPRPYADGYKGFWELPLSVQHPLAQVELVAWDSTLTLVMSKEKVLVDSFREAFPLSEDLAEYNKQFEDYGK